MEENKNVTVEETEVKVEVTEIEPGPTKKEQAWNATKKVGRCIWKAIKTATGVVGGIVIVAFAAGTAIGAAKNGEPISEVPQEPTKPDETEGLDNETTSEDPTIDVGLDV